MKRIQLPLAIALAMATCVLNAATPDAKPAPTSPVAPAEPAKPSISDLFGNDVVAKGKGVEVKRGQLDDSLITIKSNAAARGQTLPPDQVTLLEWQVLDRMIQIQLLLAKATDADRTRGEDLSSKRFEMLKSRSGTEETFRRQLNSVGMTPEALQKNMKDESVAETVLERELKVNVNDDQVKKF